MSLYSASFEENMPVDGTDTQNISVGTMEEHEDNRWRPLDQQAGGLKLSSAGERPPLAAPDVVPDFCCNNTNLLMVISPMVN